MLVVLPVTLKGWYLRLHASQSRLHTGGIFHQFFNTTSFIAGPQPGALVKKENAGILNEASFYLLTQGSNVFVRVS